MNIMYKKNLKDLCNIESGFDECKEMYKIFTKKVVNSFSENVVICQGMFIRDHVTTKK